MLYTLDEAEYDAAIDRLALEDIKSDSISLSRFKGLGETIHNSGHHHVRRVRERRY